MLPNFLSTHFKHFKIARPFFIIIHERVNLRTSRSQMFFRKAFRINIQYSQKIRNIHSKAPALESLFDKVEGAFQ